MTDAPEIDEELYEEIDFHKTMSELCIYERLNNETEIPQGFNAVTICLDGCMQSNLAWDEALETSRIFVSQGYKILFELDLGLFESLKLPIASQTQFHALALSVDQFQTQIVPEFQEHIVGVILSRTSLLFHKSLPYDFELDLNFLTWAKEKKVPENDYYKALFYRDAAIEYLELLAERLGENTHPFILVDASEITSPLLFAKLTAADCVRRLQLAICNPLFPRMSAIWQIGKDSCGYIGRLLSKFNKLDFETQIEATKTAVLLPPYFVVDPVAYEGLEEAIQFLLHEKISFKVISEEFLTTEWSGIDTLIVSSQSLSLNAKRKLAGFEAAGGEIITVPNTKLIPNFMSQQGMNQTK